MGVLLDGLWVGQAFAPPTALDIATIEGAIVAQLKSQVTAIEIAHYPDRPESWRLTHRVGAALVQYKGAEYGPKLDSAAIVQQRTLEFEVTLAMRDLGWNVGGEVAGTSPGAYAMIEAVRAALTGFVVPGCRKMYPVKERFVERDRQGGVWMYAIAFALTTLAIEAPPPALGAFPPLTKAIALEEGGETTIVAAAASYTFNSSGVIALPYGNVSNVTVTASGGRLLIAGTDYVLDNVAGTITALAGGAASAGETVQVAFSYADETIASAGETAPTN
jgi:Gp37 protein